jgi:transposase-like protein
MAKRGPEYSQKERLAIVKEGEKVGVEAVCVKYDICSQTYRNWLYSVYGIEPQKYRSSEEKLRILEESYQHEILRTCTTYGIYLPTYYYWKKKLNFQKSPRRTFSKQERLLIVNEAIYETPTSSC